MKHTATAGKTGNSNRPQSPPQNSLPARNSSGGCRGAPSRPARNRNASPPRRRKHGSRLKLSPLQKSAGYFSSAEQFRQARRIPTFPLESDSTQTETAPQFGKYLQSALRGDVRKHCAGRTADSAPSIIKKTPPEKNACLPFPHSHYLSAISGRLAQLVRASVLHTGCHRFESCIAHCLYGLQVGDLQSLLVYTPRIEWQRRGV